MKKFLALIFILISVGTAQAQLEKGATYLSLRTGQVNLEDYTPRFYGGVELDVMVSDNIGIHYSVLFGEKYFHMPLAPFGGLFVGLAIGGSRDSTDSRRIGAGILFGLLTAIIPEGISYNFKVNDAMGVAPYISPLQFEYIINKGQDSGQDSYAGGGVGIRLHMYLSEGSIRMSPFAEYKIHYSRNVHNGYSVGINFTKKIGGKNKGD
jgi:hypothetical protein